MVKRAYLLSNTKKQSFFVAVIYVIYSLSFSEILPTPPETATREDSVSLSIKANFVKATEQLG